MCGSATVAELLTAKSQGRFEATSCLLLLHSGLKTFMKSPSKDLTRYSQLAYRVVQDINVSWGRVLR